MARKTTDIEFPTKEFNLLVPFTKVDMGAGMMDGEDDETLTVEGFANWYGEDVGEDGDGVACDLAGDAVVPTGIDLSVYKGNPQILWQHDRCCSIGKANKAVRKKQGLFVNATIHKGAMEEEDWYRVKNGLVTRFSIGFRTMAGEYREINGKSIFFITKSLLLEISIVTIPCSSESGFSIIKALEDGSFMASVYTEPQPTPTEEVTNPHEKQEGEDTVKIPLRELLSAEEVEHFKSLGLESDLDAEKEVPLKSYVDSAISKAVEAAKAELREEMAKAPQEAEETTETEVKAEEETEEVAAVETEEKTEEEVETKAEEIDNETFDALRGAVEQLKAAFQAEEK